MTGSVIRLSSFHYVVIDYVPAAQPEYKVLYIVFYLRSCKNKNINDFWWLLKHFRHSWYENNCSFASLIFFSVSVSHRRGPSSSWTLLICSLICTLGRVLTEDLRMIQYVPVWLSDSATCVAMHCFIIIIIYYHVHNWTPAQLLTNLFSASQSDLHCIQCFISSCIYWESNSWPQCLSYICHLI